MDINDLHHTDVTPKPAYHNANSLIRLFFVVIFFMIIVGVAGSILLFILKTCGLKSPLVKSLVKLIAYIFALLISLKYAIRKSKEQEGEYFNINFDKVPKWLFPVLISCTVALFFVMLVPAAGLINLIPKPVAAQKLFAKTHTKDMFSIITLVIAAPILEEILCRGIVLRGLLKSYPPHKAIVISAIFFAAIHINPWQAFPAFFGGLFIGWVYYKTQSVIPGMVIHATINATVSAFLFLPSYTSNSLNSLGIPYYIILWLLAALIFSMGCILIQKKILFAPESTV